jgi:hypothetical protein
MRLSSVPILIACLTGSASPQATPVPSRPDLTGIETIVGRWDLTVTGPRDKYTSWLEVERSGSAGVVGRFVSRIGGARPIGKVEWANGVARFSIPPEWEWIGGDMTVEARPAGDSLVGTIVRPDGFRTTFVGKRAPHLRRAAPASWTAPRSLFNGKDMSGWMLAPTARSLPSHWIVRDGAFVNTEVEGSNIMTVERFQDFKLHVEFRLPPHASSGIFPRGRYWVILKDTLDPEPYNGTTGAVHRFIVPNQNAALGPNVWQSVDITLIGRRITIVVNGKTVVADQIIPGITGSAIDSDEAAPGPIMLQGEEQLVEFRNITIQVPNERGSTSTGASCANGDTVAAAAAVRGRLVEWVRQANANDGPGMNEVWAPGMVGWFPRAPLFTDSAAFAAAGVSATATGPLPSTYELVIDDLVASGSVVAVHDIWTQTRQLSQDKKAKRVIRGSELWRCQPDGHWRIARYVSAPEPWVVER